MHQIKEDEGFRLCVYADSKGLPTVGYGHLVLPEDALCIGDHITVGQADSYFNQDIHTAKYDAMNLLSNYRSQPPEVKSIITNMAYNLGRTRLRRFKKMLAALENNDYPTAADEMLDSKWAREDVPNRANRLINRMRNV